MLPTSNLRRWSCLLCRFCCFSGIAGYLSDRISKRLVVVGAKVAEILIMLLGFVGFYFYDTVGFGGMMVVLFLMGAHSAFFGPSKLGILPEMIRPADLPRANGVFLMLTFFAIILRHGRGRLFADHSIDRKWIGSLVCIGIAVVGTATAMLVRKVPAAKPDLKCDLSSWGVPPEIRAIAPPRPRTGIGDPRCGPVLDGRVDRRPSGKCVGHDSARFAVQANESDDHVD